MTDEPDVLDRLATAFRAPEPSFERFTRRRERKRRNQRFASALVAIVLATVAIGWAMNVFTRDTRERPAQSPNVITTKNVSSLQQMWAGQAGVVDGGIFEAPFIADGIAYVVSDRLYAFEANCDSGEARCAKPLWESSHETDPSAVEAWAWPPAVANGVVYVVDRVDGVLYAYSESCGTAGAACEPLWTFQLGEPPSQSAPIVQGSTLYVASFSRLYAFSTSCTHACRPTWTGPYQGHDGWEVNTTAADGLVFVTHGGELWAFPDTCDASVCGPSWVAQLPAANFYATLSLAIDRGIVYVGREGGSPRSPSPAGLYAFDEACGTGGATCRPLWSWTNASGQVVASNGVVYVQSGGKFLGFPERCGAGGATCEPSRVPRAASWGLRRVFESTGAPIVKSWQGATAIVAGDVAFEGGYRGHSLVAFDASCWTGGRKWCPYLWTATTPGLVTGTPTVAEGKVYVATGNSKIVAFGLSTPKRAQSGGSGSMRWVLFTVVAGVLIGSVWAVALRRTRERIPQGQTREEDTPEYWR